MDQHMSEPQITYMVDIDEFLRLEKALRGAEQFLGESNVPPTVRRDVEEALRLMEGIRGR